MTASRRCARTTSIAIGVALCLEARVATADDALFDVGVRLAYARPVGAFDGGTHASDARLHGSAEIGVRLGILLGG